MWLAQSEVRCRRAAVSSARWSSSSTVASVICVWAETGPIPTRREAATRRTRPRCLMVTGVGAREELGASDFLFLRLVGGEERGHPLRGHGPGEEEALAAIAPESLELGELPLRLHALRGHVRVQALRHRHHR